ncbi:MAG TPA: Ig-like domain-containing protein, partial [Thermoanaerobaculia bacterium]
TGTYGSVTIAANGAFTYTLDNSLPAVQALPQGTTETDTFNYTVDDGEATDTATLTITVTGVNDAPVFTSTADTTAPEDALYSYTVTTSDADTGAALTVTSSTLPAWLSFDGTTLTGTPANADVGSYPVTLTVSDTITTATQAFTIVVSNTNDAPVANADSGTVTEDAATNTVTGNVLANDVEVDAGDSLTVSPAVNANGTYGTAVIAANGAFTYTLDNARTAVQTLRGGHTVTDTFTYTAVDTTALGSTSALTVTITGANDAPVAAADQYLLPPAGTLNGTTVLANDTDADSVPSAEPLTAVLVSDDTAQGNLTFDTDGTFVYVKTCGPCATTVDTFTYRVNDGVANSNVVTVTIVFNTPPIPADDTYTVLEDSGTTNVAAGAGLLANDTDADLDTLTVTGITYNAASHAPGATIAMTRGTLVVNGDGSFAFTPAANAFGAETFSYQLSDGTAAASANATITITAVNDAPTFAPGANVTVLEDAAQYDLPWATSVSAGPGETQTLQFFATNSDPTRFVGGAAGDASSTATGITFTGTFGAPALRPNGNLTFRLAPNVNGAVTVSTYLRDNGGIANGGADRSALADPQFTINVTPVNDAPSFEFSQPSITQREDENCACLQPLAAFARTFTPGGGADELSQQLLQYTITADDPTFFTTLTIDPATGNLRMVPAANRYGKTIIRVRAQDNGGTANGGVDFLEKTYPVEYLPINDAPSFVKGPDVSAAAGAGAQTYPNWVVSASVGPANESAPPANTPPYTPQTINAYLVTVPAAQQALFAVQPAISTSGTLTFTPAASGSGNAVVSVQVRDSGTSGVAGCCTNVNTSATQTFVITIGNVNAPPSFSTAGDQSVPEESPAQTVTNFITAVSPGPGASDSAQTVTFAISNNNNTLFNVQPALVANGANYNLTYTPKPNTAGAATVTVTATDNGPVSPGVNSFARTFTITVTNVNDTPSFTIAANPPQSANDSGLQQVSSFATAINPGATHESTDVLTFVVTNNTNPSLFSAGPSISSAGTLTYAAAPGQTGSATITVLLRDDGSTPGVAADDLSSPTQVFTITVVPYTGNVNDPPTFTKGADESVVEDSGARTVNPWATGISGGGDDTGQSVTFLVTGNTNTALFSTQPAISPAGVLTYTPTVNAFGSATVTVVARDDGGVLGGGINTSAPQSFTITVRPKNDAPVFTASNITVAPGSGAQSRSNWISSFSSGAANESQTVTFSMTWTSANPSLFTTQPVLTGRNLTFTPAPAQNGTAVLTVTAKDNGGVVDGGVDTTVQTYNLYIENANDAPSFTKGANVTSLEDAGPQSIANWATLVSPGPADEAAQNVTFHVTTNTNTPLFSSQPALTRTGNTATLTYTAAANAFGSATITLVAKDDGGTAFGGVDTSGSQQFTITVTNVNDQPTFVIPASAPTVVKNAPAQTINNFASSISKGQANEPDTLAFTVTNDSNAIFSAQPAISSSGALTYTPASNATGTATVSVVLKDNGGVANGGVDTSVTKSFTITISEPNSPPVVPNRSINTYTNMSVTIGAANTGYRLLDNVTDVNPGSTFTLSGVSNVFSGARVDILDATLGTFKFTPAVSQTGAQTFQYTVCDNGFSGFASQCATGVVTVTVSGPNIIFVDDDAPAGGNGTLDRPLQNLPFGLWEAQTTVFVYSGTYTRTATTYLGKATQVIGQGGSGSFDSTFGINPATLVAGSLPPRPSMAGTKPVVNYPTALTPPFQSQGPFWTDSTFNGSMSLKNFTVNSPSGTCFYVHSFNSTITVDNVTMNCRHALQLNNSNTVTITNSSLTADSDGYGFYSYNTGGAAPGSTVTLTNTTINSGRMYVYGNPFDLYTFNSAVNVSRLEVTGVTVTDGNHIGAVFNGPVTATSTTSGPTVRVENARFNGTLTINATYPAYGLQVPEGGSIVATANNNSINAVNTHAIQLWNMSIPAAGVKFQTVNASGGFVAAQFWNVTGPGSFVISGGSMQPCVDIQNSPTVSVPGGTTLCP